MDPTRGLVVLLLVAHAQGLPFMKKLLALRPKPLPPPPAGPLPERPQFPMKADPVYDPFVYSRQRLQGEAQSATDEAFERMGAVINVNQNPIDYVNLIKVR